MNKGLTLSLAQEDSIYRFHTLNQLFNCGFEGLKEQDIVSTVKQYFDLVEVMNNLWMINSLIIVISGGHECIYSEGSATIGF